MLIIILFTYSLGIAQKTMAQENREAYLRGYNDTNYFKYFDSLHQFNKISFDGVTRSYKLNAIFKVDSSSSITDFEIVGIGDIEVPNILKEYLTNIIMSTNGKWEPKIKNFRKVTSENLVFLVYFAKKNQSITEKMDDGEREFIASLTDPILKEKDKIIWSKNSKRFLITLPF